MSGLLRALRRLLRPYDCWWCGEPLQGPWFGRYCPSTYRHLERLEQRYNSRHVDAEAFS